MFDLNEIFEKIDGSGPSGYFLIEDLVLEILEIEAKSKSKPIDIFVRGSDLKSNYDGYAPNGIGEIKEPLYIEIKSSLNSDGFIKLRNRWYFGDSFPEKTLLIIAIRKIGKISKFNDFIGDGKNVQKTVIVWGVEELQKIVNRNKDAFGKVFDEIFIRRLRAAKNSPSNGWEKQQSLHLSNISNIYHSGRFSLFLGAGVSSSAGLPSWDTLLNSLFVAMLLEGEGEQHKRTEEQLSAIVNRLREVDGPSAISLARYIRKGISAVSSAEDKFNEKITEKLYSLRNKEYPLSSILLNEIFRICAPARSGAKVKSVITYNFDDLLEKQLINQDIKHKSIFEEIDLPGDDDLPIYHVHGFLPESRSDYLGIEKSMLVFSEEGYHKIYGDSYHWSNLIQLNSLKENCCLMIGLSLTDPNLRRLLEISRRSTENAKHYAFLKRLDLNNFIGDNDALRNQREIISTFLDNHHNLNEQVFQELGVNVIWYRDHGDVPHLLNKIRNR